MVLTSYSSLIWIRVASVKRNRSVGEIGKILFIELCREEYQLRNIAREANEIVAQEST